MADNSFKPQPLLGSVQFSSVQEMVKILAEGITHGLVFTNFYQ